MITAEQFTQLNDKIDSIISMLSKGAMPQPKPLTPGSFQARRQAALNALHKKTER
jgi:hypothetical protein